MTSHDSNTPNHVLTPPLSSLQMIFLDHSHPDQGVYGVFSMQLATNFLLHTYFRTKKNLRYGEVVKCVLIVRDSVILNQSCVTL